MIHGYSTPLYILPFDHRASFRTGMFGWTGALSPAQCARVAAAKRVIYDGFVAAVDGGVPRDAAGILVDEEFGAEILRDAKIGGSITCVPAEKSGQDEFDFEFGTDFARHIEAFAPSFCKVLVRYNPGGDTASNLRQAARLRQLSEYLASSPSKYMFELLVPATPAQLLDVRPDSLAYDTDRRPALMVGAIRELQDAGVEPDVWKVEGLDRRQDCERLVATARRDGRGNVGCIVLGRGESEAHVRAWLAAAASVPGYIGFAVGRTTFWDALIAWRDAQITREMAVAEIARRFQEWTHVFQSARASAAGSTIAASAPAPPTLPPSTT